MAKICWGIRDGLCYTQTTEVEATFDDKLACATQDCWQISSILMRLLGSLSTMLLIRRFTSCDVAGLHEGDIMFSACLLYSKTSMSSDPGLALMRFQLAPVRHQTSCNAANHLSSSPTSSLKTLTSAPLPVWNRRNFC